MLATYESIMDAAMQLTPGDRCRIAAGLWDSVGTPPPHALEDDDLEAVLNQRESEMDQAPSQEISHQEFLTHFKARRQP